MLTPQELKKSPLFQDIGYENYQQMLDCFQAVQRSYRVDEVIYDFSGPAGNAVGVVAVSYTHLTLPTKRIV